MYEDTDLDLINFNTKQSFSPQLQLAYQMTNAQYLVKYEKQLLYEENQQSGNVMQQPMDSYICGITISMSSESILIRSYLLFAQ